MNDRQVGQDGLRTFQLMDELENNEAVSQRELANRMGVAVGLVNSYIKNLVAKGFVRVKNYPRNRYAYLLTPKGLAEKSRLAYRHLSYLNSLYTVVRQDYLVLFKHLRSQGFSKIIFCGVDDVTEIAYLSLMEAGMELDAVLDEQGLGDVFLGHKIQAIEEYLSAVAHENALVITSLKRMEALSGKLEGMSPALVFSPKSTYHL